jgi:hypothetical protein
MKRSQAKEATAHRDNSQIPASRAMGRRRRNGKGRTGGGRGEGVQDQRLPLTRK